MAYRADESETVRDLCATLPLAAPATSRIDRQALTLAQQVRADLSADRRRGGFLAPLRPLHQRGRGADVHRGSAAAHPRPGKGG